MTDEPRRLVNADVIRMQHELAMASANRTPRSTEGATVELTRNAKGDVQVSVKVSDDIADVAADSARSIFDELCREYPRTNGGAPDA